MSLQQFRDNFLLIQQKTLQALRLQQKLEKRIPPILNILKNSNKTEELLEKLITIKNIYARKLRIIEICERGLRNAWRIFEAYNKEFGKIEGVFIHVKSKLPFLIAEGDERTLIAREINVIFSEVKWQVDYAVTFSSELKNCVDKQFNLINQALLIVQNPSFQIETYKEIYLELSKQRKKELELIEELRNKNMLGSIKLKIEKSTQNMDKIAQKNQVTKKMWTAVRKYPKLTIAQVILPWFPDVTVGVPYVVAEYGLVYVPAFTALCYLVEWSPSLIALAIEMRKRSKIV